VKTALTLKAVCVCDGAVLVKVGVRLRPYIKDPVEFNWVNDCDIKVPADPEDKSKPPASMLEPSETREPDKVVEPDTTRLSVPKVPTLVFSTNTPKEPLAIRLGNCAWIYPGIFHSSLLADF
jgi:hypothetical protein